MQYNLHRIYFTIKNEKKRDFPGGSATDSVIEILSCNAGDAGSIPHASEQLSPLQLLSLHATTQKSMRCNERSCMTQRGSHVPQLRHNAGLPWWLRDKESAGQCRRRRLHPWSGMIPHAPKQRSSCTTALEPMNQSPGAATIEPVCRNHRNLHTLEPEWASTGALQSDRPRFKPLPALKLRPCNLTD